MPPPPGAPQKRPVPPWRVILVAAVAAMLFGMVSGRDQGPEPGKAVPYSEMLARIGDGQFSRAWILAEPGRVVVESEPENLHAFIPADGTERVVEALEAAEVPFEAVPPQRTGLLLSLLISLLPSILIVAFLVLLMRRRGLGGVGSLGLGRKRTAPVEVPDVRFADVAGLPEVVAELQEVVDFLHNPGRYTRTGAKVPRGFLLVGPPGTGKTLLARAVAGEAGVPFFALTGTDFVEMFVGLGASRVRELFAKVREQKRAIVFIDEIDAVGKTRGRGVQTGANDERENTLNQLLVEMDGFSRNSGIVVLAATNRADVLDPALLRPGRFDRRILVPAPDRHGREEILRLYARDRPFDPAMDWAAVARRIPGLTGAEIDQMLNEAALEAARRDADRITVAHVDSAIATSLLGRERKSAVTSERDRSIVAWHEAGHTVAALVLDDADDPVQVTIIPRGSTGGATWMGGSDNSFITRSQARARLVVSMAGRAAEEILLDGDYTQGAHGDLESATGLATEMIARYGMGADLVARSAERLMFDGPVGQQVDREVAETLEASLGQARGLLEDHRPLLEAIVENLLEHETLRIEDLRRIRDAAEGAGGPWPAPDPTTSLTDDEPKP